MCIRDSADPQLTLGIEQFNQQDFFDCHETLEDLWRLDTSGERELIQGIIQIAVGYYHYLRENRVGALKLFEMCIRDRKKVLTKNESSE